MKTFALHQCDCQFCQEEDPSPQKQWHYQFNLVLNRLDEQQRRWFVAFQANKIGEGGVRELSRICGMDEKTIRRGKQELANSLQDRPITGIRRKGGGRKKAEEEQEQKKGKDQI
jgi:hypothetical protein